MTKISQFEIRLARRGVVITKRVEYCYPTSDNAVRFKLLSGGYTVQIGTRGEPFEAVIGFPKLLTARAWADENMPYPWDKLTK